MSLSGVKKGLYIFGDEYRRRPYSREILQEVALLGLWRSKFFEKAAICDGTALRVIYGLDRFSEDMDFSLLEPSNRFDIAGYIAFLAKEIKGFGFDVRVERITKARPSPVQSAFLKADFIKIPESLSVWSREFFLDVASRIKCK